MHSDAVVAVKFSTLLPQVAGTTAEMAAPCSSKKTVRRDPALRAEYLRATLPHIPRLLGAIDRNPYRPTYGCFDREYWHYRTAAFPSEMYQEGVLPLALVYSQRLPGNAWYGQPRVRELAIAGMRFAATSSHRDGSCDDYYPFERALGSAVFSFAAATRAYELLKLSDDFLLGWFRRRAEWIIRHGESGKLTNHHALAALGLARLGRITGEEHFIRVAAERVRQVFAWQSGEGWFEEYGGADPGYQTVTIDCLAKLARQAPFVVRHFSALPEEQGTKVPDYEQEGTDVPYSERLRRAVAFARLFLHPDDSYGGEYGSRGTYHFYPHGMELLAAEDANAGVLADGFLRSLRAGRQAAFDDDRMYVHRLGNLLEAYVDWSPVRAEDPNTEEPARMEGIDWLPRAGMLVRREGDRHTVIAAARGGVFKHFRGQNPPLTDAGLILEFADGRVAVSQFHDLERDIQFEVRHLSASSEPRGTEVPHYELIVSGPLHYARFETMSPWKQAALHLGMITVGRYCRGLMRRLLQRRLITGRKPAPARLTRRFELFTSAEEAAIPPRWRVTDLIELTSHRACVRRMHIGSDHQAAYVAASGVYQSSVLQPWTDLQDRVEELNNARCVKIVREF